MIKTLTEEYIKDKYAYTSKSLAELKVINIWGKDVEDISILTKFPNLETLCLSCNNISDLSHIQNCHALKELYLRNNKIKDLKQLMHLKSLNNLRILSINDNPITQIENYRYFVEKNLPQIKNLDRFPTINYLSQFINEDEHRLIVTFIDNLKNKSVRRRSFKQCNSLIFCKKDCEKHNDNLLIKSPLFANDHKSVVLPRKSISNSNLLLSLINNKSNTDFQKHSDTEHSPEKNIISKGFKGKEENDKKGKIGFEYRNNKLSSHNGEKLNKNVVVLCQKKVYENEKNNPSSNMNFMNFDFRSCKNVVKKFK